MDSKIVFKPVSYYFIMFTCIFLFRVVLGYYYITLVGQMCTMVVLVS